jgi:iron(III) transport system ATP-binding protein
MNQPRSTPPATFAAPVTTPRVSVRGLTKKYKTRTREHVALHDVSLDIGADEFVVLLGPSGCGKTTLLRSIAGLEQPESGEILLDGEPVSSARQGVWVPPEARRLGMVFQSYALWPHMSVFENLAYPLRNAAVPSSEIGPRVTQALERVGLETLAASSPGQLSGGQQQRVALARALVSTSGLVLFDEPLSNLDAKVRARLRLELASLQRSLGFASLYVTHDQAEALALADRIAVMESGRIAQVGTPEEIYNSPATRYIADFIGSANEVQGQVVSLSATECVVTTPLGQLVGCPRAGVSGIGQTVAVMFRPEHCKVVLQATPAMPDHNRIEGVLQRSVFQGPTREHVLRAGAHLIVTLALGEEPVPSATEVAVTVPAARTMVFGLGETAR